MLYNSHFSAMLIQHYCFNQPQFKTRDILRNLKSTVNQNLINQNDTGRYLKLAEEIRISTGFQESIDECSVSY